MCDNVIILSPTTYFCILLKLVQEVYTRDTHEYLDVNNLKFTPMLVHSNYEKLSARKANILISTVDKLLAPNNGIQ